MCFEKIYEELKKYNQLHLLKYYDQLENHQKESLLKQLNEIDYSSIQKCLSKETIIPGKIEPINASRIEEINKNREKYYQMGQQAIKEGKVAAVLLAGGMGTRLGSDIPKGMYDIGINKNLYIYECIINNLLDIVEKTSTWVHIFIMTSDKTNDATIRFLEDHNYFNYNKDFITFYIQEMMPTTDFSGRILLEKPELVSMSPNGNGGWFSSMKNTKVYELIVSNKIDWLNVFSVDNVLQKIADPCFIGASIDASCDVGVKVITKVDPNERIGVMCLENGRPSIIEYYEMTEEYQNMRDPNGELSFKFGTILNYLFNVNSLKNKGCLDLPLHKVNKKIKYLSEDNGVIKPDNPNGYKYETLVLDMVKLFEHCFLYEVVREKEFAPIKNLTGVDSVDSARDLLIKNGINL